MKKIYGLFLFASCFFFVACDKDDDSGGNGNGGLLTCGEDVTFMYRGQEVTYGTLERGGLCWMDRNLGASRVPVSRTDVQGYGDLFQWGRPDDGHQDRESYTTSGPINKDVPGHSDFIMVSSSPYDWRLPQNDDLWQGEDGINNPCPPGWRLPTDAELTAELNSWDASNTTGAYASALKWPSAGRRGSTSGVVDSEEISGDVWSSGVGGTFARNLNFRSNSAHIGAYNRGNGASVRCVMD